MSETLNVDNDPVSVSLSTPDDPNPTVWVNHAVTVDATPEYRPVRSWRLDLQRQRRCGAELSGRWPDRRRRWGEDCLVHGVE